MGGCEGCGVDDSAASTVGSDLTVPAIWPFATGPWGSDMLHSCSTKLGPFQGIQLVRANISDSSLDGDRDGAVGCDCCEYCSVTAPTDQSLSIIKSIQRASRAGTVAFCVANPRPDDCRYYSSSCKSFVAKLLH